MMLWRAPGGQGLPAAYRDGVPPGVSRGERDRPWRAILAGEWLEHLFDSCWITSARLGRPKLGRKHVPLDLLDLSTQVRQMGEALAQRRADELRRLKLLDAMLADYCN